MTGIEILGWIIGFICSTEAIYLYMCRSETKNSLKNNYWLLIKAQALFASSIIWWIIFALKTALKTISFVCMLQSISVVAVIILFFFINKKLGYYIAKKR